MDAPSGTAGDVETADVSDSQKADSALTVRPRYWVDEREVLARIARVPSRVARAWMALHAAQESGDASAQDTALADLQLALAQWVAGELFHAAAGSAPSAEGWTAQQAQRHIAQVEQQLRVRFPRLDAALRGEGLTTKKALADFPKWAMQNRDARLSEAEIVALTEVLHVTALAESLRALLDFWMDRRSPRWLMGWRRNARSTDERTTIATAMPRTAQGDSVFLFSFPSSAPTVACAAFLGALNSLPFDFVARQKVGGVNYSFYFIKQLPMLPPGHYTDADFAYIAPRVLELAYTAHDLGPWAEELAAYDPRPAAEQGRPFGWNPERRAHLRAELDAYYARLYGLTRDELRYILDPKDVMGEDYPSETFRVLKESEIRAHGEYRTKRLVLEAWDRIASAGVA